MDHQEVRNRIIQSGIGDRIVDDLGYVTMEDLSFSVVQLEVEEIGLTTWIRVSDPVTFNPFGIGFIVKRGFGFGQYPEDEDPLTEEQYRVVEEIVEEQKKNFPTNF